MLILRRNTSDKNAFVVGPIKIEMWAKGEGGSMNVGVDAPFEYKVYRSEDFKDQEHENNFLEAARHQFLTKEEE